MTFATGGVPHAGSRQFGIVNKAEIDVFLELSCFFDDLPFPSSGDLSDPEIKPRFLPLQGDSLPSEPPRKPL